MLLFCAKTIVKESHKFELAHLKKKKEKHFGRPATFWFGTFAMLFSATGCVVIKTLEDEWHTVIKAYKFTISEILRDFFVL